MASVVVVQRRGAEVGRRRSPSWLGAAIERSGSIRGRSRVLRKQTEGMEELGSQQNPPATAAGLPPELETMTRLWSARELGEI